MGNPAPFTVSLPNQQGDGGCLIAGRVGFSNTACFTDDGRVVAPSDYVANGEVYYGDGFFADVCSNQAPIPGIGCTGMASVAGPFTCADGLSTFGDLSMGYKFFYSDGGGTFVGFESSEPSTCDAFGQGWSLDARVYPISDGGGGFCTTYWNGSAEVPLGCFEGDGRITATKDGQGAKDAVLMGQLTSTMGQLDAGHALRQDFTWVVNTGPSIIDPGDNGSLQQLFASPKEWITPHSGSITSIVANYEPNEADTLPDGGSRSAYTDGGWFLVDLFDTQSGIVPFGALGGNAIALLTLPCAPARGYSTATAEVIYPYYAADGGLSPDAGFAFLVPSTLFDPTLMFLINGSTLAIPQPDAGTTFTGGDIMLSADTASGIWPDGGPNLACLAHPVWGALTVTYQGYYGQ